MQIYRGINLYVGENATYNLDTKQIHAINMQGDYPPWLYQRLRNVLCTDER